MEIPKREFRGNGLGDKMLALAVLPILVLGIVLTYRFVSYYSLY